jgi:hypothetical protein
MVDLGPLKADPRTSVFLSQEPEKELELKKFIWGRKGVRKCAGTERKPNRGCSAGGNWISPWVTSRRCHRRNLQGLLPLGRNLRCSPHSCPVPAAPRAPVSPWERRHQLVPDLWVTTCSEGWVPKASTPPPSEVAWHSDLSHVPIYRTSPQGTARNAGPSPFPCKGPCFVQGIEKEK